MFNSSNAISQYPLLYKYDTNLLSIIVHKHQKRNLLIRPFVSLNVNLLDIPKLPNCLIVFGIPFNFHKKLCINSDRLYCKFNRISLDLWIK